MAKIGIIGECMVELVSQQDAYYQQGFGGDTLNTAVYLKRVAGNEVDVQYVTLLGDDELSERMLVSWQHEGIGTQLVDQIAGQVPGLYMIKTSATGERSFLYWRNQAPAKQLFMAANTDYLCQQLMQFDWIYLSGITLAIMTSAGRERLFLFLQDFRTGGGKVVFDVNHRAGLWPHNDYQDWYARMYQLTDLAMPSIEDEAAVWGEHSVDSVLARIHALGCPQVVLKCGTDPCLVSSPEGVQSYAVTAAQSMLDSTAAGDSFNGGYLAMALQGNTVSHSIAIAQQVARQVVAQKGAIVDVELPFIPLD